jgi:exodeoxyribonuclease V alpha subunit
MNRGAAGTVALNDALQAELNPKGRGLERGGRTFRIGDKVMQLRNDYDRGVYNGDVGFVVGVPQQDEAGLAVNFDDRLVELDRRAIEDLSLAYACTVHKSQGSEYPVVVIPFLTSHYMMLSRNLLYTAVTRGKKLVVLVCDPRALKIALAEDRRNERRTRLAERLTSAFHERHIG